MRSLRFANLQKCVIRGGPSITCMSATRWDIYSRERAGPADRKAVVVELPPAGWNPSRLSSRSTRTDASQGGDRLLDVGTRNMTYDELPIERKGA